MSSIPRSCAELATLFPGRPYAAQSRGFASLPAARGTLPPLHRVTFATLCPAAQGGGGVEPRSEEACAQPWPITGVSRDSTSSTNWEVPKAGICWAGNAPSHARAMTATWTRVQPEKYLREGAFRQGAHRLRRPELSPAGVRRQLLRPQQEEAATSSHFSSRPVYRRPHRPGEQAGQGGSTSARTAQAALATDRESPAKPPRRSRRLHEGGHPRWALPGEEREMSSWHERIQWEKESEVQGGLSPQWKMEQGIPRCHGKESIALSV